MTTQIILASRSPRRLELLGLVVPAARISVVPPRDAAEAGFEGLRDMPAVQARLLDIARKKYNDVAGQLAEKWAGPGGLMPQAIVAADTTIVASSDRGQIHVLGQPPEDESWKDVVRTWFRVHFAGRTHIAVTALLVGTPGEKPVERIVNTQVGFIADVEPYLNWYIDTGEPRGKAGGYAIQGAGSIFISHLSGSLSNVIGMPLEALLDCFRELQIDAAGIN
ncbi:MAG: Maf family protein [Planctomycetia bacterium]|nr:Maf family protein [Planctomycetia bacterium]